MRDFLISAMQRLLKNRCKTFEFGEGVIKRYTIVEFKNLFSIYLHAIDTIQQDRFHTHAFDAIGWTIRGGYSEQVLTNRLRNEVIEEYYVSTGVRYIPKELNHRIMESIPGTVTILFTGPYSSIWTEETKDWIKFIASGQTTLGIYPKGPATTFETYLDNIKKQCREARENNDQSFWHHSEEYIDAHSEYFKDCWSKELSAYKALTYMHFYLIEKN
jgi:hypothetical protein